MPRGTGVTLVAVGALTSGANAMARLTVRLIIWAVTVRTGFELTLATGTGDIATDINSETLVGMKRAVNGAILLSLVENLARAMFALELSDFISMRMVSSLVNLISWST